MNPSRVPRAQHTARVAGVLGRCSAPRTIGDARHGAASHLLDGDIGDAVVVPLDDVATVGLWRVVVVLAAPQVDGVEIVVHLGDAEREPPLGSGTTELTLP